MGTTYYHRQLFIPTRDAQEASLQAAYTIMASRETEDREYKPLEQIKDNYPKYVATTDIFLQKRNGIQHINIIDFMRSGEKF